MGQADKDALVDAEVLKVLANKHHGRVNNFQTRHQDNDANGARNFVFSAEVNNHVVTGSYVADKSGLLKMGHTADLPARWLVFQPR